jgi:hypothetical protein
MNNCCGKPAIRETQNTNSSDNILPLLLFGGIAGGILLFLVKKSGQR